MAGRRKAVEEEAYPQLRDLTYQKQDGSYFSVPGVDVSVTDDAGYKRTVRVPDFTGRERCSRCNGHPRTHDGGGGRVGEPVGGLLMAPRVAMEKWVLIGFACSCEYGAWRQNVTRVPFYDHVREALVGLSGAHLSALWQGLQSIGPRASLFDAWELIPETREQVMEPFRKLGVKVPFRLPSNDDLRAEKTKVLNAIRAAIPETADTMGVQDDLPF